MCGPGSGRAGFALGLLERLLDMPVTREVDQPGGGRAVAEVCKEHLRRASVALVFIVYAQWSRVVVDSAGKGTR